MIRTEYNTGWITAAYIAVSTWELIYHTSDVNPSGRQPVFFFQAEDGTRDVAVTGVHTCALPI